MKRIFSLFTALALCLGLFGCGSAASDSASGPEATSVPKDYAQIIHNARSEEQNEYYMIVAPDLTGESKYRAIDGMVEEYTAEQVESFAADLVLPLLGITDEIAADYAASASMMNTQCYGIAVVKPAEGQTDAVKAALEDFVQAQQQAFEQYLPDQYEVAKAATVTVADSGEVVLVCCENSDAVRAAILEALG